VAEEWKKERVRYNKNKVIGNGEKIWVEWVLEKGWYILNGKTAGVWGRE